MRGEQVRLKLHSGERVYGSHVCSLTNPLTAKIATQCEFDFVFICTEHMPLDRTETAMMCQFWAAHDVSPIVRIACPDPALASMALDAGAHGIVVPYVETAEEVLRLVGAVKYRPIKGKFLRDILTGQRQPKAATTSFLRDFNRDNYLIIGVESVEAVRNLEALLSVPGVDGVFIGPHDLTVSMELPAQYDHPEFLAAVEGIIRCCRRCNVGVGLHYRLLDLGLVELQRFLTAGMNWLINGADAVIAKDEMNAQLSEIRRVSGDKYRRKPASEMEMSSCINSTPGRH